MMAGRNTLQHASGTQLLVAPCKRSFFLCGRTPCADRPRARFVTGAKRSTPIMSHFRRLILVVTALLLAVTPTLAQFDQEIRQEVEDDIQDIRGLPLLEEFGVS